MASNQLIKSSFIYTLIGALPLASSFILLLFYTNYLAREDYGALVIFISFTALIQILINFGLDAYIGISFHDFKNDSVGLAKRIGIISGYLIVWGLLVIFISVIVGHHSFTLIFQNKDIFFYPYGFLSVLTAFFNSYFKTYTSLLINQEKPIQFAWVNIANFAMTIAFSLTGLYFFPYSLIGPMGGRFASGIGIFIIAFIALRKQAVLRIANKEEFRQALHFSLPVLLFFLLSWVVSSIYPFIMKYFMSLSDIAIFGLAIQFTLLVEFVLNGMSSSISPRVYRIMRDQKLKETTPEINKYFSILNAVALLTIVTSSFVIPLLLPYLINKNFADSFLFLAALNISFATRATYYYFLTPVYLFKATKVLPGIYAITALMQVGLSFILIPIYGIWGVVVTIIFTKLLQNYFLWIAARKIFIFRFNKLKFIVLPILVTIFVMTSSFLIKNVSTLLLAFTQMVLTYFFVWLFYRKELAIVLKQYKFGNFPFTGKK
jgi:O-antigen/teichoic acid export membrane protein